MSRERKGPTTIQRHACPACGHDQWGRSAFQARPVAYREVEYFGGRRAKGDKTTPVGFRLVRTVYFDELPADELRAQLTAIVARAAARMGVPLTREVVREVTRDVVKFRIPPAFKARAAEWRKNAAKWARHVEAKERKAYSSPPVQHTGRTRESWFHKDGYVTQPVQHTGRTKEQW